MIGLALLALVGFALYVMTPAERRRLLESGFALLLWMKDANGAGREACRPFLGALRARTRWVIVTPTFLALNLVVMLAVWVLGAGASSDPAALIEWGASVGPRTTNGEWWRLLTASFVHTGPLQLLVNLMALVQLGVVLERLVGPLAFSAVYVAAGLIANLAHIATTPVGVSAGASGAILGLYGLLAASVVLGARDRSGLSVSRAALLRIGPGAAVFFFYSAVDGSLQIGAELAALVLGLTAGAVLAHRLGEHAPSSRRVALASAATFAILVVSAVPLRGLADVRPVLAHIVALEGQTAGSYDTAVTRFRRGLLPAGALVNAIERDIVPPLEAARARLEALGRVPAEHQPLVASAGEYLELREESWRVRAEALRKGSMAGLQAADRIQHASLVAFRRIQPEESR